jgi:hypothetical protein
MHYDVCNIWTDWSFNAKVEKFVIFLTLNGAGVNGCKWAAVRNSGQRKSVKGFFSSFNVTKITDNATEQWEFKYIQDLDKLISKFTDIQGNQGGVGTLLHTTDKEELKMD